MARKTKLHKGHDGFYTREDLLISASAVTATKEFDLRRAKKATLFMTAASINGRIFDITLEASDDGTVWEPYNMLIDNVTNSNSQTLTRVATKQFSASGTLMLGIDLDSMYAPYWKVTATRSTEGTAGTITISVMIKEED